MRLYRTFPRPPLTPLSLGLKHQLVTFQRADDLPVSASQILMLSFQNLALGLGGAPLLQHLLMLEAEDFPHFQSL